MKKLINKPEDVVKEELQGIAAAHPDLVKVFFDPNYIVRADAPVKGKAGVISGGGSGHDRVRRAGLRRDRERPHDRHAGNQSGHRGRQRGAQRTQHQRGSQGCAGLPSRVADHARRIRGSSQV